MLYDNPAARLKAILERCMEIPSGQPCRASWEHVLGVTPNDTSEFFEKLGKVMELPKRTHSLLSTHFPHQTNNAGLWKDPIEAAFMAQQLNGQWATFTSAINPYCIPQLGLIADLLHSKVSAKTIRDDELAGVIAGFKELRELIEESSLSEQLKHYLLQEIGELLNAVRDYKIAGAIPILKQAESMVGHTLLDAEYSSFLTSHELGKRLLDNLNAAAALLTVAVSLPQLSQAFRTLLSG